MHPQEWRDLLWCQIHAPARLSDLPIDLNLNFLLVTKIMANKNGFVVVLSGGWGSPDSFLCVDTRGAEPLLRDPPNWLRSRESHLPRELILLGLPGVITLGIPMWLLARGVGVRASFDLMHPRVYLAWNKLKLQLPAPERNLLYRAFQAFCGGRTSDQALGLSHTLDHGPGGHTVFNF